MKHLVKTLSLAVAVSASVGSVSIQAYEAGDWIVRGGLTTVAPDASSSDVTLNGGDIGAALGASQSGQVDVDDNTQFGLTATYMISNRLGVEFLAATPFSHNVEGKGALQGVDIAEVTHLPPTLSAIYYLADGAFQPYLGAGLNYTVFFDEDADSELESVVGSADVDLDDSIGISVQVGFDYAVNDRWHVNGSVRWIDIETDATIDSGAGRIETNVDIDPFVYSVMLGYKF